MSKKAITIILSVLIIGTITIAIASSVCSHEYVATIIDPTCTEKGYTNYVCSKCDDNYKSDYVSATGHIDIVSSSIVGSTCTEQGYTLKTCSCGAEIKDNYVSATGHIDIVSSSIVDPTCTEEGYTLKTCSCGTKFKDNYVSATGHVSVNEICSICNENLTKSIILDFACDEFPGEQCDDVVNVFRNAGFTNIKTYPIYDLITGWLVSENEVEKVLIDDNECFGYYEEFSSNVLVKIYYHTWASNEPKIIMPYDSSYYTHLPLDVAIARLEELGFYNFETVSSCAGSFYEADIVTSVRFDDGSTFGWDAGDVFGITQLIIIKYNQKSYVKTKEENSNLLQMHEESLSPERLGEIRYSWDDCFIEIEGYIRKVDKVVGEIVFFFVLDSNKDDNISGSEIFISTGYYDNRHFEEG